MKNLFVLLCGMFLIACGDTYIVEPDGGPGGGIGSSLNAFEEDLEDLGLTPECLGNPEAGTYILRGTPTSDNSCPATFQDYTGPTYFTVGDNGTVVNYKVQSGTTYLCRNGFIYNNGTAMDAKALIAGETVPFRLRATNGLEGCLVDADAYLEFISPEESCATPGMYELKITETGCSQETSREYTYSDVFQVTYEGKAVSRSISNYSGVMLITNTDACTNHATIWLSGQTKVEVDVDLKAIKDGVSIEATSGGSSTCNPTFKIEIYPLSV